MLIIVDNPYGLAEKKVVKKLTNFGFIRAYSKYYYFLPTKEIIEYCDSLLVSGWCDDVQTIKENSEIDYFRNVLFSIEPSVRSKIDFSSVFRITRIANKLTQVQMCKKLECTQGTISKIESGTMVPDCLLYLRLCKLFTIDPFTVIKK